MKEIFKSEICGKRKRFFNGVKLVTDWQEEPMNRSDARLRQAEKDRKKTDRSSESKRQGVGREKEDGKFKG